MSELKEPLKLIGLEGVTALTGVSRATLHKTTAELAAQGLIVKVNGGWVAEASDAPRIAAAAKAIRRASGK